MSKLIFKNELSEYNDGFGDDITYVYELNDGQIKINEPHWSRLSDGSEVRKTCSITVPASHAQKIKDLIDFDYDGYGVGAMLYDKTSCFYTSFLEAVTYLQIPHKY